MLGFAKRPSVATDLGPGLFGKISTSGDFVSSGEYSPAAAHLSRWLEQGVGWAVTQAKSEWELIDFSTPKAFLFRAGRVEQSDRVIFGLLQPSRDSVGRHFPLAIYGELTLGSEWDGFAQLPLVIGEFLEGAANLLGRAAQGSDPRGLLTQLPTAIAHRLSATRAEYVEWARGTVLSTVLSALFPLAPEVHGPDTICSLRNILEPFIGRDYPETPLSVRLPLGSAGIAGAVFWLELIRRTLRWKRSVPICFWHAYADSGQLVVPIGDPSARTLLGLWVANDLDDAHCDLTTGSAANGALPPAVAEAISNDVSVADFMAAL